MYSIGDKKKVKAAPASTYHKFDGEMVEIIGVCFVVNKGEEVPVYTFKHPSMGFGAMYEHGFS